ncbi:MAG: hypothetical protein IH840_17750 [Candidatus Heimdallarchaeota archaeon]|nr:hypothetical protein [Candidatus Heimdallarchaeota archaeon]
MDTHKSIIQSQILARHKLAQYSMFNEVIVTVDRAYTTVMQHNFASDYLQEDVLDGVSGLIEDDEEDILEENLAKLLYPGMNRRMTNRVTGSQRPSGR